MEHFGTRPTDTREYRAWINMKSRCNTPSSTNYGRYGGRGIKVCPEWETSFDRFIQDMGPRPSPHHSVDRIDYDGNYEPSNCRWATMVEQSRNKSVNHMVVLDGVSTPLVDAAANAPVPYNTVLYRLRRGWNIEDAVSRVAHKGVKP